MLSLNTSISTAAKAPRPVRRLAGDLLTIIATLIIRAMNHRMPIMVSRMPLMGRFLLLRVSSKRSQTKDVTEQMARQTTMVV